MVTDLGAQSATDTAPALYFYHPDHLGSTAMVTNLDGHITQNVVYIPFGEVFVEERNGSWASPYLFNAKELDEETGLYYYGARYLDPAIALWLSTDPLQGKYPGMSPYNYCAGNPVKLVDPDGKVIKVAKKYQEQYINTLIAVFREKSDRFSFNEEGILQFNGKTKDMTIEQTVVAKGIQKVIKQSTTTNVVYEESYGVPLNNGGTINVNTTEFGGACAILAGETEGLDENYIVINPVQPKEIKVNLVTDSYYSHDMTKPRFKSSTVATNLADATYHEIGHVIYEGKSQDKVISYQNSARRSMGMPKREYDETHNCKVRKGALYETDY